MEAVITDTCRIEVQSDFGHIEEMKVSNQLQVLFDTYDNPTELIKDIEGSEKAAELREEQLYFAQQLINKIEGALKHTGSHSYKKDLEVAVLDVKHFIQQSSFEG